MKRMILHMKGIREKINATGHMDKEVDYFLALVSGRYYLSIENVIVLLKFSAYKRVLFQAVGSNYSCKTLYHAVLCTHCCPYRHMR